MQDFEFEQWSDLHAADPAEFERRREEALQAFIETANPDSRRMLEQTLFTLQMHKQKAKSPLQSAIFASNLMWESFGKLRETMEEARTVFDTARPALTVVGKSQMSQIDQIVTGWAASTALDATSQDQTGDGAQTAQSTPDTDAPVTAAATTGARIIAFPLRKRA